MRGRWKILVSILAVVALVLPALALATPAFAATSVVVTVNATPSFISIALNNTSWNFGSVAAGVDEATGTGYFGVTDSSSVTAANTIQMTTTWEATTPGGSVWTYGAAGADTARLLASDGDAAFDVTVATGAPAALHTTGAAGQDWVFEIQLDAPSSITYGDPQGGKFTISAAPS